MWVPVEREQIHVWGGGGEEYVVGWVFVGKDGGRALELGPTRLPAGKLALLTIDRELTLTAQATYLWRDMTCLSFHHENTAGVWL